MKFSTSMAVAAFVLSAGAASATTAHFDFTNEGTSYWNDVQGFSAGGVNLTVTAHTYNNDYSLTDDPAWVGRWDGYGLGACGDIDTKWNGKQYCGDENHRVDGKYDNDLLKFSFDQIVTIKEIHFGSFESVYVPYPTEWAKKCILFVCATVPVAWGVHEIADNFDFFVMDGDGLVWQFKDMVENAYLFETEFTGSMFGIGASGYKDAFKIESMKVDVIPLPAAGWLLIAGLGGLAAVGRKKRWA